MVFCSKAVVMLPIVGIPEFVFSIICSGVETLETRKLLDLLLQSTVCHNSIYRVSRARTPNPDIQKHLFTQPLFLINRSLSRVQWVCSSTAQRTQPEGIEPECSVEIVDEIMCGRAVQRDILNDEAVGQSAFM